MSIFLISLLFMFLPAQGKDVSVSVCDTMVLEYNYTYDSWGRPLTTTLAVNGGSAVTIENNTYDNYGRLASTSHGNAPKATTAYAYNIRDWITQISSTAFTEQLYYNTSHNGNTPQWGGNISAIAWQTAADSQSSKARGYNFTYDGVSRLTAANYFENNQSSGKYSTAYDYDAMSNITVLHRNGLLDDGEYGTIDHLTYEYEGNQLIKVTDSNEEEPTYAHAMHFTDGADEEVEYEYNANGATTKDENKGIEVEYNALNLPQRITSSKGSWIDYLYDAFGNKLSSAYYYYRKAPLPRDEYECIIPPPPPRLEIRRDYCGPFIYENNALKRILFNGGYITFYANSNQPEYHYYVKDHLGNIRAVINENDSIEEINHYYPYGTLFGESTGLANSVQPYKYSGKELDRMHGLDRFDHGARWSDPLLGRWHKVDPLAEKYYWLSPYALCGDNPITYIDPNGMDGIISIYGNNITIAANVYLYGSGATNSVLRQMQRDVNRTWGTNYSIQHEGNVYNVDFDIKLFLYNGKEKNSPLIITDSWNPYSRNNYIKVTDECSRSYVIDGDEGTWRSRGRDGQTLSKDDPAPHEVGHLLGLNDQYTDENGVNKGWETNIMGNSIEGKVDSRNIYDILKNVWKEYNKWLNEGNKGVFRYEINP